MTRKTLALCIAAILCLAGLTGALAEAEEEPEFYYAVTYWQPDRAQEELGITSQEAEKIVYAHILGAENPMQPLLLPSGEGKAYNYRGVRLYFETPLVESREGNRIYSVQTPQGTLEPFRVELAGIASYGLIVEIGDDFVVQQIWYDSNRNPGPGMNGDVTERYAYSPDTQMQYQFPFAAGSGCEMIVDESGTALMMMEANG